MRKKPGATQQNSYKKIVYLICAVAALGGLLFGLDQGFIANSLETIKGVYNLDVTGAEKYSAILATGGVVGALLSGVFARFLGRKKSIVLAGIIFTIGSAVSALLPSFMLLNVCRFALGFAVGVASFVVPLYLSETAPASIRGSMGVLFQLMITIGIFLISLTNVLIIKIFVTPTTQLPLMFLVIVIFSLLMFLGSIMLPESPRWLMLKGKKQLAIKMLERVFSKQEDINFEVEEINRVLHEDKDKGVKVFHGYFFKILAIGVVLQMFQQLVGINVMIYYAPTIFGYASITGAVAMLAIPTVNMLFTFPAIRWVEKFGRKKLLYLGAVCMIITMLAAGAVFQHISGAATVGTMSKAILLLAAVGYIFGFAVSWGPVAWIVCSEIFPIKSREIGMAITTIVNWTFAGIVMRYSLSFMQMFGNAALFYLFAGFCVLAIAFVAKFVPETKGITLEELEEKLKGKKAKSLKK